MAKRKQRHFKFKRSSIQRGIANSNREAIQKRVIDAIDKKFKENKVVKINLKNKKSV